LDLQKYRARITAEEEQGEDAGVAGTPTFYINGKKLNSSFEFATIEPVIQAEMKNKWLSVMTEVRRHWAFVRFRRRR
jgi:hypothetical protein